jgi:hypothetical protein
MNNANWIAEAIEQNRRATANIPKWLLDSYLPKPQTQSEAPAQPKK